MVIVLWEARWPNGWSTPKAPSQTAQVRDLAGALHCVLGQDTLLSQCLSPPRCINGFRRAYCWGVTLLWTSITSRGVAILLVA